MTTTAAECRSTGRSPVRDLIITKPEAQQEESDRNNPVALSVSPSALLVRSPQPQPLLFLPLHPARG